MSFALMSNSPHGPADARAAPSRQPAGASRRALLVACIASVLLHLVLLVAVRLQGAGVVPRVSFTVSLRAPAAAPAPVPPPNETRAVTPPPAPAPPPLQRDLPPQPQPRAAAPPVLETTPAVVPAPEATMPAPEAARADPPAPPMSQEPTPAQVAGEAAPGDPLQAAPAGEPWSHPPQPLSAPDLADVAQELRARRLVVQVAVDALGAVLTVNVPPRELEPEMVARIEQAVRDVRFLPAREEGQPVAASLRTLLCFDDAGRMDTSSEGCWMAQTPAR